MKKNLFFGALAVLSLTACSQDEVVNTNQHGNEIEFSIVTNKGSRAATLLSNANKPASFAVWAGVAGNENAVFFEGEVFKPKTGDPESWVTDALHYWPETDKLNFYAVAGAEGVSLNMDKNGVVLSADYTVKSVVAQQEDLIYAATLNKANPGGTAKTPLNFRHAMSQIVFKGKTTNPNLYVEVSEVRIGNVQGTGTFAWNVDTRGNFNKPGDQDETNDNNVLTGNWTLKGDVVGYTAPLAALCAMPNAESAYNWTDGDVAASMLLAPQTTTAWSTQNLSGSFIAVKCAMYHVAKPDATAENGGLQDTDVPVWAAKGAHKWVIIPADLAWQAGKKYIYTISFGKGNGGFKPYEPDPTDPDQPDPENPQPDPTNPEPVLTPVEFSVTIDDFDLVKGVDVEGNATI